MKLNKLSFLRRLSSASYEARLNRGGSLLKGYQIRAAIDRFKLPLPQFNNLERADEELKSNPIFIMVERKSRDTEPLGPLEEIILAEAAWEHYQSLPDSLGAITDF